MFKKTVKEISIFDQIKQFSRIHESISFVSKMKESSFDEKLCIKLACLDYRFIPYFPKSVYTKELSAVVIDSNFKGINYVPDEFRSEDLYVKLALKNNNYQGIPLRFRTQSFHSKVLTTDGLMLKKIGKNFQTPELCLIALNVCHDAFSYVRICDISGGYKHVCERLKDMMRVEKNKEFLKKKIESL